MRSLASIYICWSGVVGVVGASGADDFSSNLFSDIAPLIALFGEQVAKQYLSQSLGLLENLIFACAPLGIITAITCAIRVGGPVALQALIGRSQEPSAQVELDLLRSTSTDVCELWDGNQVVRLLGTPEILELVFDQDGSIHGRGDAMKPLPQISFWSRYFPAKQHHRDIELSEIGQLLRQDYSAPNISLNGGSIYAMELRLAAVIAVILQLGVIVFNVFSVYNSKLSTVISSEGTPSSGLPLTISGILAVSIGVFTCAWVIESRTNVVRWVSKDRSEKFHILWLQKAQVLNDQHFQSCAIFADHNRHEIIASQINWKKNLAPWVVLGAAVTSIGFICQLIGLRTLHYTAAVSQFVATIIMILLRALIRRHYSRQPIIKRIKTSSEDTSGKPLSDPSRPLNTFGIVELAEGHELNEISKQISGCKEWSIYSDGISERTFVEETDGESVATKVLQNRLKLQELCRGFWSADSSTFVQDLASKMDAILNYIWANRSESEPGEDGVEVFQWTINIATAGSMGSCLTKLHIQFLRSRDAWHVDENTLEVVLGMWLSQFFDWECRGAGDNLWLLNLSSEHQNEYAQIIYEMLLPEARQPVLISDLKEFCLSHKIDARRVHGTASSINSAAYAFKTGLISNTTLDEMCTSFLFLSFISQAASIANIEDQKATVTLDSSSRLRIDYPIFDFLSTTLSSCLPSPDQAQMITFAGLCQAGKLPDPLQAIGGILRVAVLQPKEYASKTCAAIGQIFVQQHQLLIGKSLFDEAEELCIQIPGTFREVLTEENSETVKVIEIARRLTTDANASRQVHQTIQQEPSHVSQSHVDLESGSPASTSSRQETPLSSQPSNIQGGGDNEASAVDQPPQNLPSEDDFSVESLKLHIVAGNVRNVRRCLIMMRGATENSALYMSLLAASFQAQDDCTTPRTEIIRLLILSGSGLETYRFRPSRLLYFAAKCGNLGLAKLLLERAAEKNIEVGQFGALLAAVEFGHIEVVTALLASGISPNKADEIGGTAPLHKAAVHGQFEIAKLLIAAGADIKQQTEYGSTPVSIAADRGHDELGKYLIKVEVEESSKSIDTRGVGFLYSKPDRHLQQSSLHLVARTGNIKLVTILLDSGWDVNGTTSRRTPLSCAIMSGKEDIAALLIERGARVESEQLHFAASKGLTQTAKRLLDHGADVDVLDHLKRTPLIVATDQYESKPDGYVDFVKVMIDYGADVNVTYGDGENALLLASEKGYNPLAVLLVNHGISVNGTRKNGSTAAHSAAEHGMLGLMNALIEKGAKLDALDEGKETALHMAAKKGHGDIIRALLKAQPGDWVNWKSSQPKGYTPLHHTIYEGHVDAARALLDNGADVNSSTEHYAPLPLEQAVECDKAELVELFMERGATMEIPRRENVARIAESAIRRGNLDVIRALLAKDAANPPEGKKSQATHFLPFVGRVEVAKLLLELGADISDGKAQKYAASSGKSDILKLLVEKNPEASRSLGEDLLHRAASAGDNENLSYWLDKGVPIDSRDDSGCTALHKAASSGHIKTLAFLLDRDKTPSFINAQDQYGATAMHAAIRNIVFDVPYSRLDVVKLLVERGANRKLKASGRTPLQLALSESSSSIGDYLEELDEQEAGARKT